MKLFIAHRRHTDTVSVCLFSGFGLDITSIENMFTVYVPLLCERKPRSRHCGAAEVSRGLLAAEVGTIETRKRSLLAEGRVPEAAGRSRGPRPGRRDRGGVVRAGTHASPERGVCPGPGETSAAPPGRTMRAPIRRPARVRLLPRGAR